MSATREAYHHGDLHDALVTAAVQLVERQGEADFSLREAAREVGVSANAAYRHFEDKAALMTAVAAEGFERLARRMRRAMERAHGERSSIERFKAVGRAYVEFAAEHPALFRLMFGAHGVGCLGAVDPARETPWTLLGAALDALVADGGLPAARRAGAELKAWTVVHGFASLAPSGHPALPVGRARAAAIEALLDFAVAGLREG
ncbi:MAG: TetR/AcrR family transcriptional regulator [Myxococcaceae bacterium]|nr:TetR/AcrR family transcriptional regulator [Myxococcaceae bacterium]MCA3014761.1 TetR/AcrR family transcriptional regulator [Myxococcaceae bacterium]